VESTGVVGKERVVDQVGQFLLARDRFGQDALAAQIGLGALGELVRVLALKIFRQLDFALAHDEIESFWFLVTRLVRHNGREMWGKHWREARKKWK
jgi:hypothetical protein